MWEIIRKHAIGKNMKYTAKIVNGKSPTCDKYTMLVRLKKAIYRYMNCGCDLHQHIDGKIVYLPHVTKPDDMNVFVRELS